MTLLEADNLSFSYGDRPVLLNVSLQMNDGEVVALLGPNGAGKSTLLRVLLGQLNGSGSIKWGDRELRAWGRRELACTVAYLPQAPAADDEQLVADVLRTGRAPYWGAFGIESSSDVTIVHNVARQLDLSDLLMRLMGELSGGQRQRVFVGRCLVQQPKAMLLDEPSTFLDLRHQVELAQLLRRLAREQGIAVLMASHDLNLASAFADRLVVLHDGAVAAAGPPSRVLEPQLLSQVYGLTLRRIDPPEGTAAVILPVVVD